MHAFLTENIARDIVDGRSDGFTVLSRTGERVLSGNAVGGNDGHPGVRIDDIRSLPVGLVAGMIRAYGSTADLMGQKVIGGWVHDGALYIDAPTIYVDGDEYAAAEAARERGEKAYFNITEGREVFVTDDEDNTHA